MITFDIFQLSDNFHIAAAWWVGKGFFQNPLPRCFHQVAKSFLLQGSAADSLGSSILVSRVPPTTHLPTPSLITCIHVKPNPPHLSADNETTHIVHALLVLNGLPVVKMYIVQIRTHPVAHFYKNTPRCTHMIKTYTPRSTRGRSYTCCAPESRQHTTVMWAPGKSSLVL